MELMDHSGLETGLQAQSEIGWFKIKKCVLFHIHVG